jgi:hypothetical protein
MCVATKDRAVVPKIAREGNVKKRFLTGEQQVRNSDRCR